MNTKYLLLLIFALVTGLSHAQTEKKVDLIILGGLNASTVTGLDARLDRNYIKTNYTGGIFPHLGINAGLQMQINFTENLGLKSGLLYSRKGWYSSIVSGSFVSNTRFKIGYLDIPVMFQYKLNNGLFFHAGPMLGIRVNNSVHQTYFDLDDAEKEKDIDTFEEVFDVNPSPITFGFQGGAGLEFDSGLGVNLTIQKSTSIFLIDYNYSNVTFSLSVQKSLFN